MVVGAKPSEEAKETNNMAEAIAVVDQETLLVLDLDNTVLMPAQMLGTDQWYDHMVREWISEGMPLPEAIDRSIPIWLRVHELTQVVPVEADTPALIIQQQKNGIKVMALTARPVQFIEGCIRQLTSLGLDFSLQSPWPETMNISAEDDAIFAAGVLYVGPKNSKGKVFRKFLQKTSLEPKKVVFVDDKSKHVTSMRVALSDLPIQYLGFRYGGADINYRAYDPRIALIQMRLLEEGILSDSDARSML